MRFWSATRSSQALISPHAPYFSRTYSKPTVRDRAKCPCYVRVLAFAAVILALVVPSHAQTFRVPFREINHRILIDVEVEGKPRVLLFDTGARASLLTKGSVCTLRLERNRGNLSFSCDEEAVTATFQKAEVQFDGFLGGDLLSKFSSVRIDFKAGVIELEK